VSDATDLENILESLSNGVLTLDEQDVIATANSSAVRILGAEGEPLAGRAAQSVLEAVSPGLPGHVRDVRASGAPFVRYDVDCRTLGGRDVAMNVHMVPLREPDAQRKGVVVVLDDITREKRVKSSLSRYMSKEVAEKLLADDRNPALGGLRQEVTVLFSDIRSYTTLTENASASEIVDMLNEYFTQLVDVIFDRGGILDKFIGDAIMAVFGAPFARPEQDPVNAVRAALEMQARLRRYNQGRVAQGKLPILTGIGISTGDVVCGNVGSEKRMDYTAIGDSVNLASRLEGATKLYGARIMISEFTHERLGGRFLTRELDRLRVKGKKLPVNVFEVLADASDPLEPAQARLLEAHARGIQLYR
jgi:adenylate cyclase